MLNSAGETAADCALYLLEVWAVERASLAPPAISRATASVRNSSRP
jgi:hypothetical protein